MPGTHPLSMECSAALWGQNRQKLNYLQITVEL
jgi:hypothetical protein